MAIILNKIRHGGNHPPEWANGTVLYTYRNNGGRATAQAAAPPGRPL